VTARRRPVRATANFRRNLDRIEVFLESAGAPQEFDRLLLELSLNIIPDLERFPEIGADFLHRAPLSAEGKALFARVVTLLEPAASLRQLVRGDYILLYELREDGTCLIAIRHHRQLSFDFAGHWP
jgi:hypothetical protein